MFGLIDCPTADVCANCILEPICMYLSCPMPLLTAAKYPFIEKSQHPKIGVSRTQSAGPELPQFLLKSHHHLVRRAHYPNFTTNSTKGGAILIPNGRYTLYWISPFHYFTAGNGTLDCRSDVNFRPCIFDVGVDVGPELHFDIYRIILNRWDFLYSTNCQKHTIQTYR